MKSTKRICLTMLKGLGLALLFSFPGFGAEPSMRFTPSVTNAAGSLQTTLTWSTIPAATSCAAAGHASWTGAKPAAGSLALPAITLSGTYTLTLTCTWPGDTQAALSWTIPTQNTDGSALAKCAAQTSTGPCLRSFNAYRGATTAEAAGAAAELRAINDRNATAYTWTALTPGQQCFTLTAVNGDGVESARTTPGCKTATASADQVKSTTITVNPKPNEVTGFAVQ